MQGAQFVCRWRQFKYRRTLNGCGQPAEGFDGCFGTFNDSHIRALHHRQLINRANNTTQRRLKLWIGAREGAAAAVWKHGFFGAKGEIAADLCKLRVGAERVKASDRKIETAVQAAHEFVTRSGLGIYGRAACIGDLLEFGI